MNSTWKLVGHGDRKCRVETPSGRTLGWIHGHSVGLLGLRDDEDALAWAPSLRQAIDGTLARHYRGRYRPVGDYASLRFVHDGAYEWIAAGNVPIARVCRPSSGGAGNCIALEFVLPSYASEPVAIDCAEALVAVLQERILSPLFMCEIEEGSYAASTGSVGSSPGHRERRRRERVTRQLSGERSAEMEQPPVRPARSLGRRARKAEREGHRL